MSVKKITFPHMGNYYIPISYLIKNITKQQVIVPPKITKKTIEIGSVHSPDYVCVPFKYNLGNFIESLNLGANVIFQAGGGCRYGYYAELQEQILKDLGYDYEFINFIENNNVSLKKIYKYADSLLKLHGNMINRKEEYKRICYLFDQCPTIEDAHMLSGSVFGIVKARHFKGSSLINTDSLINSYEVPPLEIEIETKVKEYKTKNIVSTIIDKSEEKANLLKQRSQQEKERKEKINHLIQAKTIDLDEQVHLDQVERRYLLKLIENYKGKPTKETEFGYFYTIEKLPGECFINSPDGIFKLESRRINIQVEEKA